MDYLNCESLILSRRKFSESSLIVTIFTKEMGRIDALAKGARREKSPMRGHLDLFNHEQIVLIERSRSSLDLVTESDVIDEFIGLRKKPAAFAAASLMRDLVCEGCMRRDPHPNIFSLLVDGFAALGNKDDCGVVSISMFFRILKDLGFAPRLEECAGCGEKLSSGQSMVLSSRKGGLLCGNCPDSGREGRKLSPKAISALRYIDTNSFKVSRRMKLETKAVLGLFDALVDYAQYVVECRLGSYPVLRSFLAKSV